jgi:hypothetical protein
VIIPIPYSVLYDAKRDSVESPTFSTEKEFHEATQTPKNLQRIVFKDEKGVIGDLCYDDVNNLRILLHTNREDWFDFWEKYAEYQTAPNDPIYLIAKRIKLRQEGLFADADKCRDAYTEMGYSTREFRSHVSVYGPPRDKRDVKDYLLTIHYTGTVSYMFEVPFENRIPCGCEGGMIPGNEPNPEYPQALQYTVCERCHGRGWTPKPKPKETLDA